MAKRLTDMSKRVMYRLKQDSMDYKEIADVFGVSYTSVYGATRLRERINPETEKPFSSLAEYQEHLVKQRINPETKKPFSSITELKTYQAKQKGFSSLTELKTYQAKQKGFSSLTEYREHLAKQRQEIRINKELSDLILISLHEMGKTQTWLAEMAGVSGQRVSQYALGKSIPHDKEVLRKLFVALHAPYKSLDEMMEDVWAKDEEMLAG